MNENTHTPTSLVPAPRLRARLPAAGLLALLCAVLVAPSAYAEPDTFGLGDGSDGPLTVNDEQTVNSYAQVREAVAAGQDFVVVSATAGFNAGDLVLVLQGAGHPLPVTSGDQTPVPLAGGAVGRWEFARVAAVVDGDPGQIEFTQPLTVAFAALATQVVKVPEYTTVTVTGTGRIVAQPWDGAMGGVVAFLATGAVNNAGVITASGRGFRGGIMLNGQDDGCDGLDLLWPHGAPKGEGVASSLYYTFDLGFPPVTAQMFGNGNVVNAGGGGVCHNSGGGGGGGAGAGGKGGRTWSGDEPPSRDVGGLGGTQLVYDPATRLLFGGGGGAGHSNDDTGTSGGNGGGIVFIRGDSLSGAGEISADGAAGGGAVNDAASGGGAGGTLYLRFTGTLTCGADRVFARGGKGGDSTFLDSPHGTGGGGGGGRVLLEGLAITCDASAAQGVAGVQPDAGAIDGPSYGAVQGSPGLVTRVVLASADPVDLLTPANGAVLTNPVVTYTGTAEPGATVTVVVNGQTLGPVTAAADGSWTVTAATPLPDGQHTAVATAVDPLGATTTDSHSFRVDTATSVAIATPAEGAVLTNPVVTYTGTAEPGATVTVVVDGQTVGTVTAAADGSWSLASAATLADGAHTVTATATDTAGNTATDTNAFTVDTATSVAIATPAEGAVLTNPVVTYTGTAEPGATVTVVVDGQTVGTVTAGADGSWSVAAVATLADGPHSVTATATDTAGNTATDTNAFTVDTATSVAITAPAEGAVLNTGTVTYTGTAEPGATVTVVVDGQTVGTVTAGADGSWSVTGATPLTDGPHSVTATATDAAGNTATDTNAFTVDTATSVAIATPAEGAVLNNGTVTYTGTAEPGATVTVVVDGQTVGTVTAGADGSWSVTGATPLTDGPHTVTATATDTAGNTATDTNTFTVDAQTSVAITTPADGVVLTNPVVTYQGTAEPGAEVTVVVDGQTVGTVTAAADGSWSVAVATSLADGSHAVTATARDAQGNTATDTHAFSVDTATSVAITAPAEGAVLGNPVVTYTGTAEPGATVTVVVDGQTVGTVTAAADGSWSLASAATLADGAHTVTATATDTAGNTATDTNAFTVDTATSVAITSPAEGAVLGNPVVTYSGTAEPGAEVTVVVDGQTLGTVTAAADGSWSLASAATLADGAHTVTATARDAQGNTATDTNTFSVNTQTVVDILLPADGAVLTNPVVTYSGTAEPGAEVTVVVDGQTLGTVTAAADGSWSLASAATLADGTHTVTATARDAQGNTATDTHAFTVDTATSVAITAPAEGAVLGNPVVTYRGTAEPGAEVTVVVDGQTLGTVTAAADGSWQIESNTTLADGAHTVTATARDAQGNTATDTNAFTVDTATSVAITAPAEGAVLNTGTVTYTGTAEPGATVTVVVDGQTVGTVTAGADGSWSVTGATPLTNGPHSVTATATDAAGNTATDTNTFTVDAQTSVAITTPAEGAVLNNGTVTYRGTAEPGAEVTVVVDGQTLGTVTAAADGSWQIESNTTLADGAHTVTATARDSQGNTATDTNAFTVDTATSVAITTPAEGAVLNTGTVTYTGTAEPGATVTVVVDGQTVGTTTAAADGTWSVTGATPLTNGPHSVTATATDAAGNTATDTNTFTVDAQTSVAIATPAEGAVLSNPVVTYTGMAEPGATVTVAVDGQTVGTVTAAADGSWSVAVATPLADGAHTVTATATDAQGNTAMDTNAFTVDTQTSVAITTPAEGAVLNTGTVTYTGTAEPGATVTVVVDGQTVGTTTAAADGTWSVTGATPLTNGSHSVTATTTDTAGNTATDTNTFTVAMTDSDGDGVDDITEIELGTDPLDADTDDDGVQDGADGLTDTDGDGTIDAKDPDSDNDGILDGTELGVTLENAPVGTNTRSPNFRPDDDPSTTTDPKRADTDGDGLNDGAEDADHNGRVGATETDPNNADTDDDGLSDGVEVRGSNATDPLNPDSDEDGLKDGVEDANHNGGLDDGETDPLNSDTDQGGASDGDEVNGGGDPLDGNDDFVVVGRGCSTGGAGTFAPLALLLLALPLLGRLRRAGRRPSRALVAGAAGGLALTGALVASPAEAQVTVPTASQAIDVQQYKPGPSVNDILGVHSARVHPHLGWNVGLSLNYADKPLNFLDPREDRFITALVRSQVGLDLMGAVGLFDRFEVGVLLPVTLQDSEPAPQVDPSFSQGVGSGGIGDLRVVPKARLVDGEDFDLALAVPVVLPTGGEADFLGGSGFGVQPRLVAEYGQKLRLAANLGVDFRSKQQLRNLHTGNSLAFGLGAEMPFTVGELPLAAAATLVGGLGFEEQDSEERPLELLAALKYRSVSGFSAHLGAGPGLTRGYGTPGFRVLGGLSYSPEPSREPKKAPPPAPVDSDGDGLVDGQDACSTEPEDKDGFEDADGCPDVDNDKDGIFDDSDKCVNEPETKNGHEDADGCPDTEPAPVDSDGDGLLDPNDGCPKSAEDKDGFEDADGCPELDNDKDGIPDTADKCPAEPEVINGVQDEDGCPDKGKVKVQVDGERILILEKVYFATAKDIILARSFPLLKQVAAVLRANPQVELLRIEGHTDDQGNDAMNLDLSKRRAANVRAFLIEEGIAAGRLESEGYGETKPVDTNKTAKGRENNRRVEFNILRVGKVEVERDAP
ncbi:Ig-like domain-containing protein [Myxococcus sp. RHSTA-1-4]|uniref:adventurous gliding motility protein AgmC n=1 Tax=Myxococcus sp. RHSTA-1-4 TaxID=2874601 RepID=UPI001CC185E3|nr:Ig-like domain-containing protein [Myxococcus sp. RHSTA-1-4]MBZ4419470.1 OmpA family protein [Myxococcus sp. RHSTA-1-4]